MDEDEAFNLGLERMSLTAPPPPGTPERDDKEKNRTQIVTISESIASPGPSPQEPSPRSVARQPPFFEGEPYSGSLDWTSPSSAATEFSAHIKLAQSIEWEKTPLGPLSSWSPQLRQMANLVMTDPGPAILFWGPSLNVIYNEHYILLAGQNHPRLMGAEPYSIFPDAAQHFDSIFEECRRTGRAIRQVDVNMFFDRHGYLEEAFFTFDMLPVLGSDGKVVGFFEPVRETTKEKLAERRLATLLGLSQLTADATSLKEYFGRIIQGLAVNSRDSPFALLYSVNEAVERLSESAGLIIERCGLEGAIGVPEGHLCAPPDLDMFNSSQGFAPAFRQVLKERQAVHIQRSDREFPRGLIEGIEWRGFKEPCREVVVLPIYPTASRKILAFLVLGINPRRAYDEPYRKYIQLLERQLSSSVAGIVLLEEEMRRSQLTAQIAAADRDELLTRVEEMEMRFKRMAEHAPVGMFNYSADGRLLWANATWYEITGHPENTEESLPFIDLVCGEDTPFVAVEWSKLMRDENLIRYEIRLKKPWTKQIPGSDEIFQGTTWVLASAYSEKDDDGTIKSIMGTITDISEQKWAEGVQDGRRKEAEELKRQQENFIDMVSHEMRNPLSAIIQSSDGIIGSLSSTKLMSDPKIVRELCDVEDSVETILQCAQHQKRIIDDILTLSKLDSELLNIIPMSIQPLTIVQRALKMFSSECQANEIEAVLVVKNSFNKLKVDWVMLDPGRLLQVLVNLITNAIKITIPENERRITLSIGASQKRPIQNEHNINYLPTKLSRKDSDLEPPEGADFFLKFAVTDTGAGLTEAESQKLFKRFSQALPRTHVQYSGSGLGLFISRELTEMQGGEIGFKSEPGKGSTFAFYIKVTPSQPPKRDPTIKRANSVASGMSHTDPDFMARLAAGKVLQNPPRSTTDPGVRESGEGDKPNVLIVEDNIVNQKVLSKQLKQKYTVHVANHGEEALAFLQNTTFWADARASPTKLGFKEGSKDVYMVLMDLEMPVMDGLTCIRRIRELQKEGKIHGHVPVIAVTANARKEQIDSALGAGMDDVMCKPFRINDLVEKMADVKHRVSQVEYQSD